jgi:hypothetical protein
MINLRSAAKISEVRTAAETDMLAVVDQLTGLGIAVAGGSTTQHSTRFKKLDLQPRAVGLALQSAIGQSRRRRQAGEATANDGNPHGPCLS